MRRVVVSIVDSWGRGRRIIIIDDGDGRHAVRGMSQRFPRQRALPSRRDFYSTGHPYSCIDRNSRPSRVDAGPADLVTST